MQTFLKFFQEDNGSFSIMRVVFFMFALHAIWASGFMLIKDCANYAGALAVFTAIAGTALTGKLIQKPMEGEPKPPIEQK